MSFPRELRGAEIPRDIEQLVRELGARLLSGLTPVHAQLRAQLARADVGVVTLTGAGLFADLHVPTDAPRVEPSDMIGGEVLMEVEGLDAPAGSLIKVQDGRIAFVEIYTLGTVGWPDRPRVLSYADPMPLPVAGFAS